MKASAPNMWWLLPVMYSLGTSPMHAEMLPNIIPDIPDVPAMLADPLGTEKDIAPYVDNQKLRPIACPTVPEDSQRRFGMGEVVTLALCNNPDTRAAYISLVSQAATYGTNFAAYFPTITASASGTYEKSFSPSGKSISRSSGISAEMTLYDFGQRELGIEIAEYTLAAAGHSYHSTLQGAIAGALQAYYRLLASQNNVVAAEESERFAQASYEAAVLRHDIGQVALADRLQAKGSLSQAVLTTQQAKNSLAVDKAALARLMGISPNEELGVEALDDNELALEPFGEQLPRLLEQAHSKRVDLLTQRVQLESARLSLKKLKRSNFATVTASANADIDQTGILHGGASQSSSIGLSVSIPIFSGFAHTYNERVAKATIETEKEQLAAAELGVTQDVWNAWHNYQTSKQSWETSRDLLDSSTQLKDVALGRYKEGIGTILDVLNAQSQYRSALQSHLQARYNLLTTRIDLVRAVGILDMETMYPATLTIVQPTTAAEPSTSFTNNDTLPLAPTLPPAAGMMLDEPLAPPPAKENP